MQLKEIKPKSKKIINKPIKTTKTMRKIILLLMILFVVASACNTGKKPQAVLNCLQSLQQNIVAETP